MAQSGRALGAQSVLCGARARCFARVAVGRSRFLGLSITRLFMPPEIAFSRQTVFSEHAHVPHWSPQPYPRRLAEPRQ